MTSSSSARNDLLAELIKLHDDSSLVAEMFAGSSDDEIRAAIERANAARQSIASTGRLFTLWDDAVFHVIEDGC